MRNLAELQMGRSVPGDCGSDPTVVPQWRNTDLETNNIRRYDNDKMKAFFERNCFSLVFGQHCAMTMGFCMPELLGALVCTKRTDTKSKALSRYVSTLDHTMKWHTGGDLFVPTSESFQSTQRVRHLHNAARKAIEKHHPGMNLMSAYNMALVQSAGVSLLVCGNHKSIAVRATAEEVDEYVDLWRCIGHQLGIPDEFNLCSEGTTTCRHIIEEFVKTELIPHSFRASRETPQYNKMTAAYIGGINDHLFFGLPVLSAASTVAFVLYALNKKPDYSSASDIPSLSPADALRLLLLKLFVWIVSLFPDWCNRLAHVFLLRQINLVRPERNNID